MLSTLLDIRITIALSFSLAVMAGMMALLVAFASRAAKRPLLERDSVRGFKGDALSTTVRLPPKSIRWVSVRPSSVVAGRSVTNATFEGGAVSVPLPTMAAGRVRGLRLRLDLSDPMGLFSKAKEMVYTEFTLDVLPSSLARPPSARRVSVLASGEVPAGSPGMGQELFSVEEYRPSTDTKNIIWKRVARSPEQSLFTRIRESNVPSTVRIGLLEVAERGEERVKWMDLLCEGVGLLGKELIELGSAVEFLYGSPGGLAVLRVTTHQELADSLMEFSGSMPDARFAAQIVSESDAVATGLRELERPEIAGSLFSKPSLFIHERASPLSIGDRSLLFSGSENILPLLARLLEI